MTKAEMIAKYGEAWYEEHKIRKNQKCKEQYKNNPEVRLAKLEYQKEYREDRNKSAEYRRYNKEYKRRYCKEYNLKSLNSNGKTKVNIRSQSKYILFHKRHHIRIKSYQIHHCFGYDDPSKFIYIPKSLHIKIHQYLRDNKIDADSNHYDYIKHIINECEEYTYISV